MTNSDSLLDRLASVDPEARELVTTPDISWVRMRLGIIGEVRLSEETPIERAPQLIGEQIERAHALLDQLPLSVFRRSDMWNLLLFVSVPYNSDSPHDAAAKLEAKCRDLVGSRKVLLWKGQRIQDELGPLTRRSLGLVGLDDPLGDVLIREARDDSDRRALQVLFKRRLEDSDIDELIRALGREKPQ